MLTALIILVCAALNRVRGTSLGPLPGRPLYYIAIAIAAIGGALHSWHGLLYGVAYLAWGLPGWGHLYTLGRFIPDRPWGWDERLFFRLGGENYYVAFGLRHAIMLPVSYFTLLALLFPVMAVAAYELACRVRPSNPIWIAELLVGALWGTLLVIGG